VKKGFVMFRGRDVIAGWPEKVAAAQRFYPAVRVPWHAQVTCRDCACARGELHVPGCDAERCPKCGGQLISCECPESNAIRVGLGTEWKLPGH
jgi:hypothetical protein